MDNKITFLVARFIQVLFGVYFKHIIAHLETNWLHFWCNILAAVFDVAKSLVRGAVEVWKSLCPLWSNLLKNIWWNRQLRAASVNDGWVWSVLSWFLHCFTSIVHALSFQGPCSKPIFEVLECFKSLGSSDNLCGVISTEKSIWCLSHLSWGNTETHHGPVDNLIILEGPQVVKLLFLHIFMRWKAENTIRIMAQSLWFVKC